MGHFSHKQNFLGGVAVLTMAVVVVKLISAVYKIPLGNLLDDEGMGHFNIAYNVYNFLLQLSTAGFPLALSKMTSEAMALGHFNQVRRQFRVAAVLFFVLGAAASAVMFFCAGPLAELMNNSLAYYPIKVLSPAVFFVCLIGCFRGYTQGRGNMVPTAASQVLEATFKLFIGLGLAWYVLNTLSVSVEIGAAAAIFGVTVGSAAAALFLITWLLRHRLSSRSGEQAQRAGPILKKLLLIGVPITLGSSVMSIITLVDQTVVMARLQNGLGLAEQAAAALYGQYTFGMTLFNLPATFVYPVTVSLIPAVSAALTRQNTLQANRIISSSFRTHRIVLAAGGRWAVGAGSTDPAAVVSSGAGHSRSRSLSSADPRCGSGIRLPDDSDQRHPAGLRAGVYPHCHRSDRRCGENLHHLYPVRQSCFRYQGRAHQHHGMLCRNRRIEPVRFGRRAGKSRPRYLPLLCKPALAAALMGGCAHFVFRFLHTAAGLSPQWAVLAAIVLAASFYAFLALLLRMVTREDLALIPKGEKIAKILHIR